MANITTIDVGVVTPVPKDEYSATVAYERLNIVSFNGSSYMAKQNTTGHLPTDTIYWMLLAKKGDQGPDVAVVTQPIITGMNDVVAGSPNTYEVQSTSLLVGNSISRFNYRVGSGTVQSADAVNGRADIQVTVPSDVSVGTTVPLFVTAYDEDGHSNYNQKNLDVVTPVIAVPTVTGVISGSTNVGINPTITVSAFSVYPSGYDTAKQVRYKLFNGTTNLLIEESTRKINSNGGSFTLNNLLSVNTKYRIEVWWEGNKISSDKYISTFTTLNAFITAPVLSVKTDTASTALRPQITVGSFVVSPNGFDTPKNLTYEIRLKSNNSIIDSGTKSISSSGGAFTPNKDLILNTNYVIKAKWVGNIIESPYTSKDFKTIDAFITTPTITGVTNGQTGVILKPTFTVGAFSVTPTGFDSPSNLTYVITKQSDGSTVESGTRNISTSGGTFQPTNNLPLDTLLTIKCKWVGNILTSPETVINFKTLASKIDKPVFVAPEAGASALSALVTAVVGPFSGVGDTHTSTTWRLKKVADNSVLQEAVNSSDLLTHNFIDVNISTDTECYAEAVFNGDFVSSSAGRSASFTLTAVNSFPSGRKWYPHSSGKGLVMLFNDGQDREVLIPYAQYRPTTTYQWGATFKDTLLKNYSSENNRGDIFTNTTGSAIPAGNPPAMTDAELNSLWVNSIDEKTAKQNCDVWMNYSDTGAVHWCRNLTLDGVAPNGCDVPNFQTLIRIFVEANNIDNADPTVNSYKDRALGTKNSSGFWWNTAVCASTEFNHMYIRVVHYGGQSLYCDKYDADRVVPVLEL